MLIAWWVPKYTEIQRHAVTLCCSSFLWRTLAVSSWACWMGMSSLRAISALWSQAPITPRGPGRDLSRWMCQSSSCNWHPLKNPLCQSKIPPSRRLPHVHKLSGYKRDFMSVDVDRSMNKTSSVPACSSLIQTCTPLNSHWQWINRSRELCFSRYDNFQLQQSNFSSKESLSDK